MRKFLLPLYVFIMIGLSACGGGGSGGDGGSAGGESGGEPQDSAPVWQQNLPDDPGSAATETLAGVDANANGIRDDLERDAALTASSEENFKATVALIQVLQQTIDPSTNAENVAQVAQSEYCAMKNRSESANDDLPEEILRVLVFDTEERKAAQRAYIRLYGVRIASEGEASCES